MKCPIDTNIDLVMTDRQGIEIDYCPSCRGVWLDRGELDKLIERSAAALPMPAPAVAPVMPMPAADHRPPYRPDSPPDDRRPRWDDDDDDDDRHKSRDGYAYKKKKRSSILGEIFDF